MVSFLANLGSAFIAVPILLLTVGQGSVWVDLIFAVKAIKDFSADEILIYLWGIIAFSWVFVIACVLSFFPEILIVRTLKAPEERLGRNIVVANIASYACIMGGLIGLGVWIGITPSLNVWDILEEFFVYLVPLDSAVTLLQQIIFLFGIILTFFLIIWNYNKKAMSDETR